MIQISKRAGPEDAAKKFIATVWKVDQGPLENIFRILPYAAVPFLGGLGSIAALIVTNLASHMLGVSPQDFGRYLDNYFGLGPGDDPREGNVLSELERLINKFVATKIASEYASPHAISKTANIWSMLLKSGKIGSWLAKAVYKLIGGLLILYSTV